MTLGSDGGRGEEYIEVWIVCEDEDEEEIQRCDIDMLGVWGWGRL